MSFSNDKTRQISYHVLNFPEWRKIIHKNRLRLPVLANFLPHRWYCGAWKHKTLPLPESDPSYRLDNLLPDIFYRKHRQDSSHCGLQRVLFEVPGSFFAFSCSASSNSIVFIKHPPLSRDMQKRPAKYNADLLVFYCF